MKTASVLMLASLLGARLPAAASPASPVQTEEQKTFYALGALMGRNLSSLRLTPEEARYVSLGVQDSAAGRKLLADPEAYRAKIDALAQTRQAAAVQEEKKRGKAFLEKAAKQKGAVVSKESGIVLIPVLEGKGGSPKPDSKVRVHYTGTLADAKPGQELTAGTKFDSSVDRGTPAEFPLNGVISCWTEGVQKMRAGGKAVLVCPSTAAYGDNGAPPRIPGGAALVFQIELLDILK